MSKLLQNGVARTLIRNIPSKLGGEYIVAVPDCYRKAVDRLPAKWELIDYQDDVWDFTPYFTLVCSPLHRFDFSRLPEDLRDVLKEYVAYLIDRPGNFGKGRIRATRRKFGILSSMLKNILKLEPLGIEYAHTAAFIEVATNGSIRTRYERLKLLLDFIQRTSAVGHIYHIDRTAFKDEMRKAAKIEKYLAKRHHENIPRPLFDSIIRSMDKTMRDESVPFNHRITAGMILIQTQLGLRITELCALKTESQGRISPTTP